MDRGHACVGGGYRLGQVLLHHAVVSIGTFFNVAVFVICYCREKLYNVYYWFNCDIFL